MNYLRNLICTVVMAMMIMVANGGFAAEEAGGNSASAEKQLLEMIKSGKDYPASVLMPLFEKLQPASMDFMMGTWHGGVFDHTKPDPIRWYGKRFNAADDVEPLLCTKEDGTVYAWDKWGKARLRNAEFGGKVQATLIYDQKPMMDYFRKVTDDLVIGLGDIKGRPTNFFFWLERVK